MCSQFGITTDGKVLTKSMAIKIPDPLAKWDLRVQGYLKTDKAPVIVFNGDGFELKTMNWSLCPHWAKEYPFKPSTYNARLERPKRKKIDGKYQIVKDQQGKEVSEYIFQVPSFRDAFNNGQTCLVPLTYAVESSYFGEMAGNIIRIGVEGDELFFVAGLFSDWLNKETGEVVETFTLLTDNPYQKFFEWGHDRSVFTLHPDSHHDWLTKSFTGQERLRFLRDSRADMPWAVKVDREMKKGWEKRCPTKAEIEEIASSVWINT